MANADEIPMHSTFMDYPEHERTYLGFLNAAKWGTIVVVAIVILMAFFLI